MAAESPVSKGDFEGLGVSTCLAEAVKNAFQIDVATAIQEKAIVCLSDPEKRGSDVLIRSRTGSGKTLAFVLPILNCLLAEKRLSPVSDQPGSSLRSLGTLAVIIVPTRELAVQTQKVLESLLAKLKGKDHWLVSCTLSGGDKKKSEKACLRKGVHIVVGTPGRLLDHLQSTAKWAKQLQETCRWVVLDEADRLLDSGFEKSVRDILERITGAGKRPQLILCSATVEASKKEIFGFPLKSPILISQAESNKSSRKNTTETVDATSSESTNFNAQLEHFYLCTPTKFRLAALLGLLEESFSSGTPQKIVLFTICCDTVDYLYALLYGSLLKLVAAQANVFKLHGNLDHKTRMETFTTFTKEAGNCVLVCTDIAARGLNLVHVSSIIQYDAPCDMNDYIHRAGRTARQGEQGKCYIFLMPSERDYIQELAKKNMIIKALKWTSLVERIANKVKLPSSEAEKMSAMDQNDGAEQVGIEASLDTRKRIFYWLYQLQQSIQTKGELLNLAKDAFLSFARAYATHPSSEKAIFHVKKLHLGHLAETFLLSEAPKAVAAKQNVINPPKSKAQLHNASRKPTHAKPKRLVSEFDAGDANASFMQPRKAKHGKK